MSRGVREEANELLQDIASSEAMAGRHNPHAIVTESSTPSPDLPTDVVSRLQQRTSFLEAMRDTARETGHVFLSASTAFSVAGKGTNWSKVREHVRGGWRGSGQGKADDSMNRRPPVRSWTKLVVDATKAARLLRSRRGRLKAFLTWKPKTRRATDAGGPVMYRVVRKQGSWRRELSGAQDAMSLVTAKVGSAGRFCESSYGPHKLLVPTPRQASAVYSRGAPNYT